jgi:hypothetical protein
MQMVLNVPDALAERAHNAGLLDQQAILRLLDEELRRRDPQTDTSLPVSQLSEAERAERVRRLCATMDRIASEARRRGLTDDEVDDLLQDG